MGLMRPAKSGLGTALELIANGLRADGNAVTREPLPERWIDLIRHLDEQEQRSTKRKR